MRPKHSAVNQRANRPAGPRPTASRQSEVKQASSQEAHEAARKQQLGEPASPPALRPPLSLSLLSRSRRRSRSATAAGRWWSSSLLQILGGGGVGGAKTKATSRLASRERSRGPGDSSLAHASPTASDPISSRVPQPSPAARPGARAPMATAATASHPASASTSGRDAPAAASSSTAAVCLVPFRFVALPSPRFLFPASPDRAAAAAAAAAVAVSERAPT
jgi:hypothetical protein